MAHERSGKVRKARPLAFAKPPIWELAISASFGAPILSMYDIREVHDLFRSRFPVAEQQAPYGGLQPYPATGTILQPQPQFIQFVGPPGGARWWLISDTGTDLIQIQENFLARNWRRLAPPPGEISPYPGFDEIFGDYRSVVDELEGWAKKTGYPFPEPTIVELLYENLISLERPDGSRFRTSEIITPLLFDPPLKSAALNLSWFEFIDEENYDSNLDLRVELGMAGLPASEGDEMTPYIKLSFRARRLVSSWMDGFEFINLAHSVLRDRLVTLTTEECRATWNQA